MDGTFSCCPLPFCHIYSVHAMVGTQEGTNKIVPLVYGLLSHKTMRCYEIFLEILCRFAQNTLKINLAPQIILTDFEIAAINAVKKVFPNCANKLCFFHLNQSIWRKIQSSGLTVRYSSDPEFAHKMRHIGALAFLEPTEIDDAFDVIKNEIIPEEAKEVLQWFEKYYVKGTTKILKTVSSKITVKQTLPRFPPRMWSIHENLVQHIPLSQNALESWHNRWNSLLGRRKWNLYKTIIEFKKEQVNTEATVERIISSEPMPKRKRGSLYKERIIQHLSEKQAMDTKTYLNGWALICHLIK